MLIVLAGLPGTGKSTLAKGLARELGAAYVRVDTIEQAIRDEGVGGKDLGPAGYLVGYGVALDTLRVGVGVVADSVNPLRLTRDAWRNVGVQARVEVVEVELVCSDRAEHRRRVGSRSTDIIGLELPSWEDVTSRHYETWNRDRIVIDTARRSVGESLQEVLKALADRPSGEALADTPSRDGETGTGL